MFARTVILRTIGFYVVLHPWLTNAGVVKVGYSTNIEQRLETASYKTCFTPEWRFLLVLECETELDALVLEQSVLYCLSEKRVSRRELLTCSGDEAVRVAIEISKSLKINTVAHYNFENSCQDTGNAKGALISASKVDLIQEDDIDEENLTSVAPMRSSSSHSERERASPKVSSTSAEKSTDHLQMAIAPFLDILNNIKNPPPSSPVSENGISPLVPSRWGSKNEELDLDFNDQLYTKFYSFDKSYELQSLRPYQQKAVRLIKAELLKHGKCICQMACRCGKTPVAFQIIKEYLCNDTCSGSSTCQKTQGKGRIAIYLVPGLALLRQTAQKLYQYGLGPLVRFLLIGSEADPVLCSFTSAFSMTTDPHIINSVASEDKPLIIISTYHSSGLLTEIHSRSALVVFDECHRVCGSSEPTAFNTLLRLPQSGARLFMTATPTYDTPVKMNDESVFGGVAYRYYLREGINAGYVNSFAVRVILGESMENFNPYFLEAMTLVDKMLVFCRDVEHAEKLCRALQPESESPSGGTKPFTVLVAHSRMGSGGVASTLLHFMNIKRAVLFNVRLFQEGVEIPDLNAVFFATPRYSSRDIIQSICRPLNKVEGKPVSYVFLPAVMNTKYPETHPINLQSFSTLVPFTDALMDEDPSLFEYMIDPQSKVYNFSVVGVRSLPLSTDRIQQFILPAIRRGVRFSSRNSDRLSRSNRLPWPIVFKELSRIVKECRRYPKTNDAWVVGKTSLSMNRFYQFCRRGYRLYERGLPTFLQTHQIRDLESLEKWRQYGVNGPYPWKECFQTLEKVFETYGACPPLDVHKGGYVGLDATPMERLCGFLMGVNQSDAKMALRLHPSKVEALDELSKKYGFRWRKARDAKGVVIPHGPPTFITTSFNAFKYMHKYQSDRPAVKLYLNTNFPGYPEKHLRMEQLDTLQRGCTPPRYNPSSWAVREDETMASRPPSSAVESGRRVMCRVCREHILVERWEEHVSSVSHRRRISPGRNRS